MSTDAGSKKKRSEQQKFELYLRLRQINQVKLVLNRIRHLPQGQQKAWLEENSDIFNTAINRMIDDSNFVLNEIELDDEVLLLTKDIIQGLRDSMNEMGKIVYKEQELEA